MNDSLKGTLREVISRINQLKEDEGRTVFAKRIEGEFKSWSDAVIITLGEDEHEFQVAAELYCPGYDYFLEVFLIKEMLEDLPSQHQQEAFNERVERIIYYAEYDA